MSKASTSTKLYLWFILMGFGALGYIFSEMEADISVGLTGQSVRGAGNYFVRSKVDGTISEVATAKGANVASGDLIVRLSTLELDDEIATVDAEILGVEAVLESKRQTQSIYENEIEAVKALVDKRLEPMSALRAAKLELALAKASMIEVLGELDVLKARRGLMERRKERYTVTTPVDGSVLELHRFAEGDVLKTGDIIAEIVPRDGELVFETKVSPADIADVKVGYSARISFVAANRYEAKPVTGKVTYVSASTMEEKDGTVFFTANVTLDEGQEENIPEGLAAEVGHQVEISITSGQRSVLAFIMSPLVRGAQKVFSER